MSDTPIHPSEAAAPTEKPAEPGHIHLLHWLLAAASLVSFREQARDTVRNYAARAELQGAAVLLWVAAGAFALAALAVGLATLVGLLGALAVVAAILALTAAILHLVAARIGRHRRKWSWQTPFSEIDNALKSNHVDEAAVGALLLAAITGLILGLRSGKH